MPPIIVPISPSPRRKSDHNRIILRQFQDGATLAALAKQHGLSPHRIKQLIAREIGYVEREAELAYALTLPDQPNALLLTPATRAMVASVTGRSDFTRQDVLAVGWVEICRVYGFYAKHRRELEKWLGDNRTTVTSITRPLR